MAKDSLGIGLLGCGIVGSGAARHLLREAETVARAVGRPIEIRRVAVRNLAKKRDVDLDQSLYTHDVSDVVADPSVDLVVEAIGGIEPARSAILQAIELGKPVVSANKELLSTLGADLFRAADDKGVDLYFEAAVAGGIPLMRPLKESLAGETIKRVTGIVNGTTNFILSAMAGEGSDYADALAAAQAAGYAEADPAGDVEGLDAANKLVILARLAFDTWLDPAAVRTTRDGPPGHGKPGITGVAASDIAAAAADGHVIRLIAQAEATADGSIEASVLPTRVPAHSGLGRTGGVLNRIEVDAEPLGSVAFEGPGAGGGATAVSVLGDLLAIARGEGSTWDGRPQAPDLRAAAAGGGR